MSKTYDEIYEEDVKKVKQWINNENPFLFDNKDTGSWQYDGYYLSDAIGEFVDPVLNPNTLWKIAEQEIEKILQNLYHNENNFKPFITNVGDIYATYCFINKNNIKFYNKNQQIIVCLKITDFTFVKDNEGVYIFQR